MTNRRRAFLIGGAALVVLAVASTFAVMHVNNNSACGNYRSPQREAVILRCTEIIQSSRVTPHERAKAFAGRGQLHELAGKFDRAVEDYDQALRLNPNDVEVLVKRGYVLLAKRETARALQDLDQAIRLKPTHTAHHYRAWAHHANGDRDRAIQDYDQAIRLVPRDGFFDIALAALHLDRGKTYTEMGNHDRAVLDFDEGLRVGGVNPVFEIRLRTYNIPTFHLSSDGRVVKFSGGVNFGAARALARLLAAHPSIKAIHLHSPGGSMSQAHEIANVIRSRGLDTYVSDRCESACTTLFLAGRERLIGPAARIGFHQTSVRGTPSIDGTALLKADLLRFGVSEPFVERALQTKPDAIWHPPHAQILAERIATRAVDATAFPPPVYPPQPQLKGVDLLHTFGEKQLKAGKCDEAIKLFDAVIRYDPEHVLALVRRGDAYHEKGDLDRAIQDYDQVMRIDPQSATAFSHRGLTKLAKGDNDAALQDFAKAIQLLPGDPDVNYYRGLAHLRKKNLDLAIDCFNAVIVSAPEYQSALEARGEVHLAKGDYDRAIRDFDRALHLDPAAAATWNNRCWARVLAGRPEAALADCNESLRLRADFAETLDSRGFAYFKLGDYDKAIADFDAALKLAPKQAGSLYGRGLAKLRKGDADGGNADIAAGRAIEPAIDEQFARYSLRAD